MELVLMQNRNADFLIKPVNPDGTAYTPDGSITDVVFAVRSGEFGNVLISKDLEWDEGQSGYVLNLEASETAVLSEGEYAYGIYYVTTDGGIYDLIETERLFVKRSV
jgi:hypothetical protein